MNSLKLPLGASLESGIELNAQVGDRALPRNGFIPTEEGAGCNPPAALAKEI